MQREYELKQISGKIPPRKDSNVRPGDMMGLTIDQVQEYIKRQKKAKGFSQALTVGDGNIIPINLPGNARVMLGFVIDYGRLGAGILNGDGNITMILNNEVMIEDSFVNFFSSEYTDEEYYFFPRPLSGNDDLKVLVKGVTFNYSLFLNFYYL